MIRRNLAIDVGLALLLFALALAMIGEGGFGESPVQGHPLDWPGVLLAAGSSLPLVARRWAPLWIYLVTTVASVLLLLLFYPYDLPLGPLAATYSLGMAYGGDPRRTYRIAMLVAAELFTPIVAMTYAVRGEDVSDLLVPEMLVLSLMSSAAWLAGDRTRLRRERILALEERARYNEREAERERRLAAAEERTRIARELHDSAGHAINVILVQAGAARLLYDRDPEQSRRAIATIENVARETINEIDRIVRALREDNSEPAPARPGALEELVERHRTHGLSINADIQGDGRSLPHSVAWAAYRILQEALTNATRHGTGNADVTVRFGSDAVEITVLNPTPPSSTKPTREHTRNGGHGIVGMRERASLLGGTLDITNGDGMFRLYARLPCDTVVS